MSSLVFVHFAWWCRQYRYPLNFFARNFLLTHVFFFAICLQNWIFLNIFVKSLPSVHWDVRCSSYILPKNRSIWVHWWMIYIFCLVVGCRCTQIVYRHASSFLVCYISHKWNMFWVIDSDCDKIHVCDVPSKLFVYNYLSSTFLDTMGVLKYLYWLCWSFSLIWSEFLECISVIGVVLKIEEQYSKYFSLFRCQIYLLGFLEIVLRNSDIKWKDGRKNAKFLTILWILSNFFRVETASYIPTKMVSERKKAHALENTDNH